MTGDELERAIDFILKSQARAEARIERNEEQLARNVELVARNEELVARLAEQTAQQSADFQVRHEATEDAHANLVRVMTQHLETEDRINKSLRVADARQARLIASLGETLRASEESRRASEESLSVAMTGLATRQGRTEATVDRLSQKVEALVKVVEEERNGGR
jgi:hypothetical protein